MIKIFYALSLEELEKKVNDFEKEYNGVYSFSQHTIAYGNGKYIMSVEVSLKSYHH